MDLVSYGITYLDESMMWLLKVSFIAMLLLASCRSQMQVCSSLADVKMNITTLKDTITQTKKVLPLVVEISNTSGNDIAILNFADFSTDSLSVFQLVIEKSGKKKISPAGLLEKRRKLQASDYKKLKSGETLSFKYNLDMSLLVDDNKHLGQKNNDFGTYRIKVIYNDRCRKMRKPVHRFESNVLEALYVR